ncbi:hypothetical protein [Pseudohongiella spirulinae]|nr:hypothetical protein [Pseudohongiella spirulinae]
MSDPTEHKIMYRSLSLLIAAAAFSSLSQAQSWTPPLTEHGYPDLQGVWNIATVTNLERGPQFEGRAALTAEEVATIGTDGERYLDNLRNNRSGRGDDDVGGYDAFWMDPGEQMAMIDGMYRTSIIVDPENGRLPWREGIRSTLRTRPEGAGAFDGPETRGAAERCLVGFGSSGGPPMMPVLYNNHSQIVQTEDYVMILAEMNHDARIIRLNTSHDPRGLPKWLGDSVGRYEGNTLVVESTNFHPLEAPRGSLRHYFWVSSDAKVTERFTRMDEDTILYQFEVDDPAVYTQVWRGELPMRSVPGPIYEYACHEGNYALPGILAGARVAEQEAE